jgi:hypothetical protein
MKQKAPPRPLDRLAARVITKWRDIRAARRLRRQLRDASRQA